MNSEIMGYEQKIKVLEEELKVMNERVTYHEKEIYRFSYHCGGVGGSGVEK